MDEEKARKKEARRTLNRIKSTLRKVEQDPAAGLEKTQEYQRMKDLLEHGYAHRKPGQIQYLLILLRHPVFFVTGIILVLLMLM